MIEPLYSPAADRYESGMAYSRCGRSGVMMPQISLGLWHNFGDINTMSNSRKMLHFALDNGITYFDLANNYGPSYGSAEETFGQVMARDLHPYRDEMFIATKAGYEMWPGPYGNWGSRKYLITSLNQSLRRMGLDYVDVFYSHRYDPDTPEEETLQALVDIVKQGKALYAGISRWPLEASRRAFAYLREHDVPCLLFQDRLNIIDRTVVESGVLEAASRAGCGFVSFSPLAQGILTNRYLGGIPADSRAAINFSLKTSSISSEVVEQLRMLDNMARQRGQTLAEMALAWVLRDTRVTSVIIGCSSKEQLMDCIGTVGSPEFTTAELEEIDSIGARIRPLV